MDFRDILRLARRPWRTIAAMFVLALVIAGAWSFTVTPVHHSTSRVFISTDVSDSNDAHLIDKLDLDMTPSVGLDELHRRRGGGR